MDVPSIVRQVLEVSGLTQTQLGKKVGVSQGTISRWISGGHSPNTEQWERLVTFANRFPKLRAIVKGYPTGRISIMGYIGAGAEITPDDEQVPPEGLEEVELLTAVPEGLIAFRVKGDSMRPAFRDGDVVLVYKEPRSSAESYYGDEVAVKTRDGRRYVKELQPGRRAGMFNLASHNAALIPDVRLDWIGEIYGTVRTRQVREIASRAA